MKLKKSIEKSYKPKMPKAIAMPKVKMDRPKIKNTKVRTKKVRYD